MYCCWQAELLLLGERAATSLMAARSFAGETHELRQELANPSREKKKDAVKKVIANMTVGKDVSMLFTDVVNCIQTGTLAGLDRVMTSQLVLIRV